MHIGFGGTFEAVQLSLKNIDDMDVLGGLGPMRSELHCTEKHEDVK